MKKLFTLILGLVITFSIASTIAPKAHANTQSNKPKTQKTHRFPKWSMHWHINWNITNPAKINWHSF